MANIANRLFVENTYSIILRKECSFVPGICTIIVLSPHRYWLQESYMSRIRVACSLFVEFKRKVRFGVIAYTILQFAKLMNDRNELLSFRA